MTQSKSELIDRGWSAGWSNWADADIVSGMRCKHRACGGRLTLETWTKPAKIDRCFTNCRKCGHRKEF